MADLFRGPWPGGALPDGWPGRADDLGEDVLPQIREIEERVATLRREAVVAVVHQRQIEAQLAPLREETGRIEAEALRALQRGQERLARQILHRRLGTLALRDSLRDELTEARHRTIGLLKSAVGLEKRARRTRRGDDEWARPSGGRVKPAEP